MSTTKKTTKKFTNLGSKTLATLMIVALLSVSVVSLGGPKANALTATRTETQLARITQRHDRKMTLRASVLGISADELKTELKTKTFDQVMKEHGFKDRAAYYTALVGKLKIELKARGWSDAKISEFVAKREARYEAAQS